jgi:tetratricopeptide (TPR) repeat protein
MLDRTVGIHGFHMVSELSIASRKQLIFSMSAEQIGYLATAGGTIQAGSVVGSEDISLHLDIANTLLNLKLYVNAIKRFDDVIELADGRQDILKAAWNHKGNALFNLSKYEEAIVQYCKALDLCPIYVEAWYNKGLALHNLGKHKEAIACYDEALEIKPDYVGARYNRACSKVKIRDIENALADLKKAVEINKDYIRIAKQDKDFESIRDDERFKALV